MNTYYVYLLECKDGSYYVGVTNDLERRMLEHKTGFDPTCYTFSRRPVELKNYLTFQYISEAIYFEKKIKKWSRAKKEAFFKKDWNLLREKARCQNSSSHNNYQKPKESSGDETPQF